MFRVVFPVRKSSAEPVSHGDMWLSNRLRGLVSTERLSGMPSARSANFEDGLNFKLTSRSRRGKCLGIQRPAVSEDGEP